MRRVVGFLALLVGVVMVAVAVDPYWVSSVVTTGPRRYHYYYIAPDAGPPVQLPVAAAVFFVGFWLLRSRNGRDRRKRLVVLCGFVSSILALGSAAYFGARLSVPAAMNVPYAMVVTSSTYATLVQSSFRTERVELLVFGAFIAVLGFFLVWRPRLQG